MKIRKTVVLAAVIGLGSMLGAVANAQEAGDWIVRVGVGHVDPKSDNGDVASVDSGTAAVFNGTYMMTNNVGIELLAATPFSHDIDLAADGTRVGETKHLPPTVSLQYHFDTNSAFKPYVGAGLNFTVFFDEETEGPLAGDDLELDESFGVAVQVGADWQFSDTMFANLDVRYIDIETDATLQTDTGSVDLGSVDISPIVYSLTVGWRFGN